jgi:tetratricopeptide (TPR) repeat protein
VANIEIHKNFFGNGFSGSISAPVLSWSDRNMLEQAAGSARELAALRTTVENMGGAIAGSVLESLTFLESQLGLRLDAQCIRLDAQLDVLERIDQALRRPGQTRAAERIANTGELLRRGRYERALSDAQIAIEDDPNNPVGFLAAAWACMGLHRGGDAQRFFTEAAEASDGDERAEALRQAARLAFALEDAAAALRLLSAADDQISDFGRQALAYDAAVYQADSGDHDAASRSLATAVEADERFAFMALADPLLEAHAGLLALARTSIEKRVSALAAGRRAVIQQTDAAQAALESYGGPTTIDAADARDSLQHEVATLRAELQTSLARSDGHLDSTDDDLTELNRRASRILAAAREWPERAEASFRNETAQETQAQRAAVLQAFASRFANERSAIPMLKGDGSWVITRQRAFGRNQAWRAHLAGEQTVVEEIPWEARDGWRRS